MWKFEDSAASFKYRKRYAAAVAYLFLVAVSNLICSFGLLEQKLEYIHMNPVRAEWVNEPEYYRYSSARNYAGELSMLEVELLE